MTSGTAGGDVDADFRHRLATEINAWERDGLIAADQAQAILRRYEPSAGGALPASSYPGDDEPLFRLQTPGSASSSSAGPFPSSA